MYMPSSYMSLPLGLNQPDYDATLSEYIGVDKLVLQQLAANAGISIENAAAIIAQKKAMIDPQQQMIAQAIAAFAAASNNNNNNGVDTNSNNNNNSNNISQQRHQSSNSSRNILENIELLNSKFINQKQHTGGTSNETSQSHANNFSNNNGNNTSNNGGSVNDFNMNMSNLSHSMKRQSNAFQSLNQTALFSTPMPTPPSPSSNHSAFTNSRLNSTPNLQYGNGNSNGNEQSR